MIPPTLSTDTLHWVLDTTGFELLFGLKNETTKEWLFRYEVPLANQRSHSALLVPLLKEACTVAKVQLHQVSRLTVCIGPGSFTGLRAGLATVKTLGQWMPALAITPVTVFERVRLQAVLSHKTAPPASLTILLDAKQNRLYTATWSKTSGWEAPQFMMLDDWLKIHATAQQQGWLIVNESLLLAVVGKQPLPIITVEQLAPVALEALSLVCPAPVTWQQLAPLYLQSPNITVKKTIIKDVC